MAKPRAILLKGYFARNFGDDLFFKIVFDRYPRVRWRLLTDDKTYEKIFSQYKSVRVIRSCKSITVAGQTFNIFTLLNNKFLHFRKYAGILELGGSIFMQHSQWRRKLRSRSVLLAQFKRYGKKAFIVGANFGPDNTEEFRQRYRNLFSQYDDICFRDLCSYRMFQNMAHVRKAPDVVFNLDVSGYRPERQVAGISVIDLSNRPDLKQFHGSYSRKVHEFARNYLEQGYCVKLFSFCEKQGDLRAADSVHERLADQWGDQVRVLNYEGDINTFLAEFAGCEVIVGTRFHSVVLALLLRQKLVPIIYSNKTCNVLSDLKLGNYGYRIENLDEIDVNEAASAAENVKLKDESIVLAAEKQFQELDQFLARRSTEE